MNSFNPETSQRSHQSENSNSSEERFEHPVETRKNSRMAFYIAFLALFFTAVGITVGYKHWLRIDDKAESALEEINLIKEQLSQTADKKKLEELRDNLTQTSNDAEKKLEKSLLELDKIREQTTYSAETVNEQIANLTQRQHSLGATPPTHKSIQLAEVHFLLNSARHRFKLDYDKDNALLLLKAADHLLIQIASPTLLIVRENLAKDIATLEQFSAPEPSVLSSTIRQLDSDIKPLLEIEKELTNGTQVDVFDSIDDMSITGKIKGYINDSVSIRKQTTLPRYAPSHSDKTLIDQLLRMRLESLRLMAMQRQNKEFHLQIKSLEKMLKLYYSVVDAKPWLATLAELDTADLAPEHAHISSALDALVDTLSKEETNTANLAETKDTK